MPGNQLFSKHNTIFDNYNYSFFQWFDQKEGNVTIG